MKKSKFLILLITLTFPVILYLFLRSYGQNEFALPVFFEDGKTSRCADTGDIEKRTVLYSLDLQDSMGLKEVYKTHYKVLHFPNPENTEIQTLKNELNRVLNTFDDLSIHIVSFISIDSIGGKSEPSVFLEKERTKTYLYSPENREAFVNCAFAFPTENWEGEHPAEMELPLENTLILLDEENRIRGYYDGFETKEVDRLILEIRVLLSNR